MNTSKRDTSQEAAEIGDDVVAELERVVRRLGYESGIVTLEAVFEAGSYVRGYVKRGPIRADELRSLQHADA